VSTLLRDAFRHEALLYAGEEEFLARTVPFIRDAVAAGEPILVAVSNERADAIKAQLNGEAERVRFLDMPNVGKNPARIMPAWRDFVAEHADSSVRLRGIGEPIWRGRSSAELVECGHHESLLNLAFADARGFWLLCPYDIDTLAADVVVDAKRNHPYVANGHVSHLSRGYRDPEVAPGPFDGELPPPETETDVLPFRKDTLRDVRTFVAGRAQRAGLAKDRVDELVLSISELAANSIVHAGGRGTLCVWQEADELLCEVRDTGRLQYPLLGRERPAPDQASGRGLWLVNQLCDLVQMRSRGSGTVVRVHMDLG
jgi:anti-sigma regulatory factor (Ser/Thr protein kinase)